MSSFYACLCPHIGYPGQRHMNLQKNYPQLNLHEHDINFKSSWICSPQLPQVLLSPHSHHRLITLFLFDMGRPLAPSFKIGRSLRPLIRSSSARLRFVCQQCRAVQISASPTTETPSMAPRDAFGEPTSSSTDLAGKHVQFLF